MGTIIAIVATITGVVVVKKLVQLWSCFSSLTEEDWDGVEKAYGPKGEKPPENTRAENNNKSEYKEEKISAVSNVGFSVFCAVVIAGGLYLCAIFFPGAFPSTYESATNPIILTMIGIATFLIFWAGLSVN